jgi:NAD(P)-dependent dehydrogenase (short-subunit alcohol dehydrogenase family)
MPSYAAKSTGEEVASDCHNQIVGKTVLITGTTPGGLGAVFALIIAKHAPASIILATRSISKAEQTARDIVAVSNTIRTHCIEVDLEDPDSVRQAADKVNALDECIDVIVNNAAIMGTSFTKTKGGIERHFAANHVGHFLLTNLLLFKILAAKKPIRVVNVSSNGFRFSPVRLEDWNFGVSDPRAKLHSTKKTVVVSIIDNCLYRMARATTNGRHMGNQKLPTCYSPCHSPRNSETAVSCR